MENIFNSLTLSLANSFKELFTDYIEKLESFINISSQKQLLRALMSELHPDRRSDEKEKKLSEQLFKYFTNNPEKSRDLLTELKSLILKDQENKESKNLAPCTLLIFSEDYHNSNNNTNSDGDENSKFEKFKLRPF